MLTTINYKGDTKMVVKTSLLKEVSPMPTYNQEKNFNPIYLLLQIGDKQPFLLLNENLCYVEYDAEETGSFDMIAVKVVFRSNNTCAVPMIKDFRVIACL